VDVLTAISTALVLWYGARLVTSGQLSPGDLVIFLVYLKRAFKPARDFAKYVARLAKATAAGERVIDLLEQTPDVRDLAQAKPAHFFRGSLELVNVSFAYDRDHHVLEHLNLQIQAGRRTVIAGPSGAGKSTLLSLIPRLYDPTDGRVMIDGRDIRDYTIESLRSQISVVLQDSILFAVTIRENIAYGAPGSTQAEIEGAARLACADGFISRLPQGYDTVVGERGITLSHGQRQRIAIARAAIRKTSILLLDEPTASLDEKNARAVITALEHASENRTTLLTTHRMELASQADEIFYMEDGRIVESGTHDRLIEANGRYAAMYRLQASSRDKVMTEYPSALIS